MPEVLRKLVRAFYTTALTAVLLGYFVAGLRGVVAAAALLLSLPGLLLRTASRLLTSARWRIRRQGRNR